MKTLGIGPANVRELQTLPADRIMAAYFATMRRMNVDQMTRYFITKSNVPDVALTRWRIFSKYSMFNILTHKFKGDDELRTTLMSTGKNTLKCSDPSLYGQKGVDHIVPMNDSMIKEHCDDLSEIMMAIREQFDYEFIQSYAHM